MIGKRKSTAWSTPGNGGDIGKFNVAINVLSPLSGPIKLVADGIIAPLDNVSPGTKDNSVVVKTTFDAQVAILNAAISAIGQGEVTLTTGIIAHAGGGQSLATVLTTNVNVVSTVAITGDSVKFTTGPATTSDTVVIINRGANSLNAFPAAGGSIDSLGINAPFAVPSNTIMIFRSSSTTQWYSETLPSTGGTGDVVGPASSTIGAVPIFFDGTGKLIGESGMITPDGNSLQFLDTAGILFEVGGGLNASGGAISLGNNGIGTVTTVDLGIGGTSEVILRATGNTTVFGSATTNIIGQTAIETDAPAYDIANAAGTMIGINANNIIDIVPGGVAGAVILPRITTAQRDALVGITNGMMIYNTTTNKFQGRQAGAWVDLA